MSLTRCIYCNYAYDEWHGDPRNGVPAGTPLDAMAGTVCSRCGIQGIRHERQPSPKYEGLEAECYDQFAGKAGIAFYRDWLDTWQGAASVLELGVGTGRLAVELAGRTASYCGVDWSSDMLRVAETKRKRIFKEEAETRLTLAEEDALLFRPSVPFSHVLCPDGLLQHFTRMDDQIALLRRISGSLEEGGWLAVDLHLPPARAVWEGLHCKRTTPNKLVCRKVEGETSLSRQLFRCTLTYDAYLDRTMTSRYRVEREFALLTPKEAALLLASEGFEVMRVLQNYGSAVPWETALPPGFAGRGTEPALERTAEEAWAAGEDVRPYRSDVWTNGGYPFHATMPASSPDAPATMTLIARKRR